MRAPSHPQRDAARGGADHHTLIRVGDVVAHLLHAARSDEWRVGAYVGAQAGRRHPGRNPDGVLFGDADLDEALAIALDVGTDPEQVLSVGGDHDGAGLARGELEQRLAEREPGLVSGAGAPIGRSGAGDGHGSPSSASARARISSFTLLLCQR